MSQISGTGAAGEASADGSAPSTSETPWPVHILSQKIKAWIDRLGPVWVEGQIVQWDVRGSTAFAVLRDTDADASIRVTLFGNVLHTLTQAIKPGARVVVNAKTSFWVKNGSLQLQAATIREVGIGELLARVEELKRRLADEGLFSAERKTALPFAPQVIGLICGRDAKAKDDVVNNSLRRWPGLEFDIHEVAVQGPRCVPEVSAAIKALDANPRVQVIVVARGGGAVEDLLPFSNEDLVRTAAACATPLVSAIGHETDSPLLDLVADYRASTPTDAAKRIVPDMAEESAGLARARLTLSDVLTRRLDMESQHLFLLATRPALADPSWIVDTHANEIERLTGQVHMAISQRVDKARTHIATLSAQVRALSPQATLDRGYAVVQTAANGAIIRRSDEAAPGTGLRIRVANGAFAATAD